MGEIALNLGGIALKYAQNCRKWLSDGELGSNCAKFTHFLTVAGIWHVKVNRLFLRYKF